MLAAYSADAWGRPFFTVRNAMVLRIIWFLQYESYGFYHTNGRSMLAAFSPDAWGRPFLQYETRFPAAPLERARTDSPRDACRLLAGLPEQ